MYLTRIVNLCNVKGNYDRIVNLCDVCNTVRGMESKGIVG